MSEQDQDMAWEIDSTGWKMKDQRAYGKALREAVETGDYGLIYPFYQRLVKAWPYQLDPKKAESYDELEPEQWVEVRTRVVGALGARFR